MPRYVEVAVQLPVRRTFCYSVPARVEADSLVGSRVLAPFGNRGVSGVVVRESEAPPPEVEKVRDLDALLDEPPVPDELLSLCLWIADYYEAPPGEVLRAALPAGTSVAAVQRVELTEEGERALAGEGAALTRSRRELLAAVAGKGGAVEQRKLLRGRGRLAALEELASLGLVRLVRDPGRARVKARTERVAVLSREPDDEEAAALARAPRRREVLEALRRHGGEAPVAALRREIARAPAHVRSLVRAGLVEVEERRVEESLVAENPEAGGMVAPADPPPLTGAQQRAFDEVRAGLEAGSFHAYVLHGVTGSGKTEVYLRAIAEAQEAGRGAIVLVPEISLTPQLAARFRARFGDRVAVLHSGLTDRERFEEWHRLRRGEARIALGARSAIYAPVFDLGIVVVDEEHDGSFKQEEGVRYHARDVALVRAQRAGAACVLGSATPSLETYHGAEVGRYRLLELPERATSAPMPEVEVIDLRDYQPDPDSFLTAPLAAAVEEALGRGEQVILFLNRRGFNTFVVCVGCGQAFRCEQCAVSLTYHRHRDQLMCHYCGHAERPPDRCPGCGAEAIVRRGLGTERVADGVAERFPDARVVRLDRDVGGGRRVAQVLGRMARREVDILVGTQMVTKGHDFPGVTLVGVLCADTGLSLPDFRASEKTFQLLAQVAGRAGRADQPGRVLVQSYRAGEPAIVAARDHDYLRFYRGELVSRRELGYPPFGHLVAVRIDGPDGAEVARSARELARRAAAVRDQVGDAVSVLGPCEAPLARLKGRTRWHLWLRGDERRSLRKFLRALVTSGDPPAARVRISVDVDPVSAL